MLLYRYTQATYRLSKRLKPPYRASYGARTTFFTTSSKSTILEDEKEQQTNKIIDNGDDDEKLDKRVWPIAASNLMMGTAIGVLMPVMPLFAQKIGITTAELGAAVSEAGPQLS